MTATDPAATGAEGVRPAIAYRPVRPEELPACAEIWRVSINDYIRKFAQPDVPTEVGPLLRLYAHLQATDPERFVVGVRPDPDADGGERVVAFAAAAMRERLWFLSMCFVLPEAQGAGVGRALLDQVAPPTAPDGVRATATDSAQPISNALYATYDVVPRMPLLHLIGLPRRPEAFGELPSGVVTIPFDEIAAAAPGRGTGVDPGTDDLGHRLLVDAVDGLDRELLGVAHPIDHRFFRSEARRGWLYRGPDGTVLGYGYAGEAGRVGPIAVRDEALLGPVLGHLTSAVVPRGSFAVWIGGASDRALVPALRAGFRLEQFPVLLCWDRPFADFSRYVPNSPGLL